MTYVRLAEHPVVEGSFARMQALNGPLGVDAFGVNAALLDPDDGSDTTHTEADDPQQEVYIVVSGRARFTIGGEEIDAEPGTVLAAPDPLVPRGYRALEPGTRIVCIGRRSEGPPQPYGAWIGEESGA
jgi:uncharacterized cupin superfamily protein